MILIISFFVQNNIESFYNPINFTNQLLIQQKQQNIIVSEDYSIILPDEIIYKKRANNNFEFYLENQYIGGMNAYTINNNLNFSNRLKDGNIDEITNIFLDILGFHNERLEKISYFGNNGSNCDFELWIKEGIDDELNKVHYFFINEKCIYDIYFKENILNTIEINSILSNFYLK